nr:hypothetical protein [uncultured Rhodopila sp.]
MRATIASSHRLSVIEASFRYDRKHECLYSLGATDRYLRVVPGQPSHDLLAMARQGMRTRLRSAIQQASQDDARVSIQGGRTGDESHPGTFSIDVRPVRSEGEDLLLVCFVDDPSIDWRIRKRTSCRLGSGH